MYKSIIVPLDGSARSQVAIPVAAALARASGATLDLVRVHHTEQSIREDDPHWDEMFVEGEQRHLDALALAYEPIVGSKVRTTLLHPPVVTSLVEFAEARDSPLIVIAGRGRTGLRRAVLGSVADGLVRHGGIPVLVLRGHTEDQDPPTWSNGSHPFSRVLVPLDGTALAEGAIAHALAIAGPLHAQLRLVRVVGPVLGRAVLGDVATEPVRSLEDAIAARHDAADDYLQGIVDRIRTSNASLDVLTQTSIDVDPASAILECCERCATDLIVMATHGRGMSRMLVSAVGDRVLRDGPDAILFIVPSSPKAVGEAHDAARGRRTGRVPQIVK